MYMCMYMTETDLYIYIHTYIHTYIVTTNDLSFAERTMKKRLLRHQGR
jgi:hypothetical protein